MNYVDKNTPVHENDGFENDATWKLQITKYTHEKSNEAK